MKFLYLILLAALIGGCDQFTEPETAFELYQQCVEDIEIEDKTLIRARTLACRRELSTLSEEYIPLNNRVTTGATFLNEGRSILLHEIKNESKTRIVAGIEIWTAFPTSQTALCEKLSQAKASSGVPGCQVTYTSTPVWLAPESSASVQFDIGEARLDGNYSWSWGIQSYRYFELSPSRLDQEMDLMRRR